MPSRFTTNLKSFEGIFSAVLRDAGALVGQGGPTDGTLCSKLTETHLVALLPYQYKAST